MSKSAAIKAIEQLTFSELVDVIEVASHLLRKASGLAAEPEKDNYVAMGEQTLMPRIPGQDKGKIFISSDFNAPLPDSVLNSFLDPQ